jgi:hypothetical protein
MTDQEKIDLLGEALNNLMQSADTYIVDGSWIDELTLDIENARALLKRMTNCIIQMRHDLAEEGYSVPASRTFSNYDTLDDDLYISADELKGATFGDDPADPDDHPFCYLQLKDGRSLYFIGADLDFIYKLKIVQTE